MASMKAGMNVIMEQTKQINKEFGELREKMHEDETGMTEMKK